MLMAFIMPMVMLIFTIVIWVTLFTIKVGWKETKKILGEDLKKL